MGSGQGLETSFSELDMIGLLYHPWPDGFRTVQHCFVFLYLGVSRSAEETENVARFPSCAASDYYTTTALKQPRSKSWEGVS